MALRTYAILSAEHIVVAKAVADDAALPVSWRRHALILRIDDARIEVGWVWDGRQFSEPQAIEDARIATARHEAEKVALAQLEAGFEFQGKRIPLPTSVRARIALGAIRPDAQLMAEDGSVVTLGAGEIAAFEAGLAAHVKAIEVAEITEQQRARLEKPLPVELPRAEPVVIEAIPAALARIE